MDIEDQDVYEFMALYNKGTNEHISFEDAKFRLEELVRLYLLVGRPLPRGVDQMGDKGDVGDVKH